MELGEHDILPVQSEDEYVSRCSEIKHTSSRMAKKLAIHLWPQVLSCHLGITWMYQNARALLARSKLCEVEVYGITLLLHALLCLKISTKEI